MQATQFEIEIKIAAYCYIRTAKPVISNLSSGFRLNCFEDHN